MKSIIRKFPKENNYLQDIRDYLVEIYKGLSNNNIIKEKLNTIINFINDYIQYKYIKRPDLLERIDVEFLGKIYESYNSSKRKKIGIYYTPIYIVESIVRNSVSYLLNQYIDEFISALETEDLNHIQSCINKIISFKILDPACGSGLFILKSFEILIEVYEKIKKIIIIKKSQLHYTNQNTFFNKIMTKLGFFDKSSIFLLKIILRHLFFNDLDKYAINISIFNLWIELSRKLYKISDERISFFLFYKLLIGINVSNSDYIIQLDNELIINNLDINIKNDLEILDKYKAILLDNPLNFIILTKLIEKKECIKKDILKNHVNFKDISGNLIDYNFTFLLDYWFIFFNKGELNLYENKEYFNVILGNPPYIPWYKILNRQMLENKTFLDLEYECRPNHKDSQPNIYLFFIVKSINLINTGIISFILPQEWRSHKVVDKFKNYFLKKTSQITLIRFNPKLKIFKDINGKTIGTNSMICNFEINKKIQNNYIFERYLEFDNEIELINALKHLNFYKKTDNLVKKSYKEAENKSWVFIDKEIDDLIKYITNLDNLAYLNDENFFKVCGGFQPPVNKIHLFEIDQFTFQSLNLQEKKYVFPAIINANQINKYLLFRSGKYWIVLNEIESIDELKINYPNLYHILSSRIRQKKNKWWHFPNIRNFSLIKSNELKILSPRTAKFNSFAIDNLKSVFKGTNTMIISSKIDIYYLTGILNSKLANIWYSILGQDYHSSIYKKYEPEKVKRFTIPIKQSDEDTTIKIKNLVKSLLKLKQNRINNKKDIELNHFHSKRLSKIKNETNKDEDIKKIEDLIDQYIYKIYNLNNRQIKIINKYFSK
ncbi:MAG: hypothetical protein ACTSPY_02085 [Candidatus Helarchaeota archaeon]